MLTLFSTFSRMPSTEENFLIARQRWKHDLRCINVIQMLDSRRPIFIPSNNEVSFIDGSKLKVRLKKMKGNMYF